MLRCARCEGFVPAAPTVCPNCSNSGSKKRGGFLAFAGAGAAAFTLDSTYGANGTCWSTGVAATAESCTATCKSTTASLKTSYPDAGC